MSFLLKPDNKSNHVIGLNLLITGSIDGQASFSLMQDGKPYRTAEVTGDFNIKWGNDWYSETAEIKYSPKNVKAGSGVINYRFRYIE